MEFFSKVFTWLANLSSKLPQFDVKTYFIIVLVVIAATGIIIGFTFIGSKASKLKAACKKIKKYLADVDTINDENVGEFTAECFSQKAPQSLRDSWVEYLGVRFGYPSDSVSEKSVYDKEVKKVKDWRANLFIGIALILVGIFAFWGFGTLASIEMSVIHCAGLLLSAVIYLVLVFVKRKQIQSTREAFYDMQDDLDAKVNFQVEKNFSTDSSPLSDLAAMVDEIIARNTAKEIDLEEEEQEPTPIEDLIEEIESRNDEEEPEEEVVQEEIQEIQEEKAEEPAEEPVQEETAEEPEEEEKPEEEIEEEPAPVEKKEPLALKESIAAAKMAGYTAFNKKFFGEYLKSKYGDGVEVNERENKTSTGLPLADTYFALDGSARKCFVYAYEIDGSTLLLCNADSEFEARVKEKHENINLSAFPKSKDTWYSLPIDDTYTGDELKGILDYCYAHALGEQPVEEPEEPIEEPVPVEEPVEEPIEEPVEEQVEEQAEETVEEAAEETVEETAQESEEVAEEPAEETTEEEAEEPEEPEEPAEEPVEDEPQEEDEPAEEEPQEEELEEEEPEEESEEPGEESEEADEESEEDFDEEEESEDDEDDETVVYVVDGDEEEDDEEYIQPSKLSKLSNLTDYMLSQNMSRKVKMQVATLLIGVYNKFKDNPQDKKIIVDCLKKVIISLQREQLAARQQAEEAAASQEDNNNDQE